MEGFPVPDVSWTFTGQPVNTSYVTSDATSTNLSIHSLEVTHQGVYTLNASNVAGEATAEFTLNILGGFCDKIHV